MLITSIMGVEWRLPSSTDEQRGSQADQWVLSGGHTTTTTNTMHHALHSVHNAWTSLLHCHITDPSHYVTINHMSSHRPMGLKSECSAQCVPGGPKLPAGGGSHISCSRPGGLKDISLDNHPVGLEVWPCLCLSVSVWASVCRSLDPIIALHCPAVSQSVSYWYSCTWLLSPWQLLKFDYDSRTASPLVTPSFLESHKQATKISSKTLT